MMFLLTNELYYAIIYSIDITDKGGFPYVFVIKYFNDKDVPLVEDRSKPDWQDLTMLCTGVDDDSEYNFKVKSFEAATYDNKYVS